MCFPFQSAPMINQRSKTSAIGSARSIIHTRLLPIKMLYYRLSKYTKLVFLYRSLYWNKNKSVENFVLFFWIAYVKLYIIIIRHSAFLYFLCDFINVTFKKNKFCNWKIVAFFIKCCIFAQNCAYVKKRKNINTVSFTPKRLYIQRIESVAWVFRIQRETGRRFTCLLCKRQS